MDRCGDGQVREDSWLGRVMEGSGTINMCCWEASVQTRTMQNTLGT